MRLGDLGLRTKIMAQGFVPIVLLVLLAFFGMANLRSVLRNAEWVDHTRRVIEQGDRLEDYALKMQTGMRGFLLTGNEEFLGPYADSQHRLSEGFAALKKQIGTGSELKLIDDAEQVLETWRNTVAVPAVELRREIGEGKGMDHMATLVAQGKGKKFLDQFRGQIKTFINKEKDRMTELTARTASETGIEQMRKSLSLLNHSYMAMEQAMRIMAAALEMDAGVQGYLITGIDEYLEPYEAASKQIFSLLQDSKPMVADSPDQVNLLQEMEVCLEEWVRDVAKPEIALRRKIAASKTMKDLHEWVAKGADKIHFDKFEALLGSFRHQEEALMKQREADAQEYVNFTQNVRAVGTIVAILAAFGLAYVFSGAITRPVLDAVALAEAISQGDLSKSLKVKTRDEIGRLGSSLNAMVAGLRDQTRQIREGVDVLVSACSDISSTVSQVAASTSETSAAVTQTSATVEQVKQAANVANENARNVAASSQAAVNISESGRQATEATIQRMSIIKEQVTSIGDTVVRLSEHSQAIENIIAAVQDLADQSNLLAVNASIEAARAGDQGKGFAVVAHEIKALADQSRQATAQVDTILKDTRKWVSAVVMATEQGSKAVDAGVIESGQAGEAIQKLADNVVASANAASVISATSEQQFAGVDQVSRAMLSIDSAMQQNMQGHTQLERATQRLQELGRQLRQAVERYTV